MRRGLTNCCAVVLTAFAVSEANAQDARLARRLDAATAARISAFADSVQQRGLPSEPLFHKALEGASKGASANAIVAAVHALAGRLAEVRASLGTVSVAALVAGAAALDAGASASDLQRLRPHAGASELPNACIGLTFLLQRGVSAEGAVGIVSAMLDAKLSGQDFTTLERLVDQDVRAGAAAADAARVRSRALIIHGSRLRPRLPGAA